MNPKQLSVIIPTYNRLGRLKDVLTALEAQTYPLEQFEVIVVSDGSSDGTHAYLAHIQTRLQLHAIIQENQGPAAARNAGIARATGEIVVFLDDDVVPVPVFLAEHMRIHQHQPAAIVLGPMLSPPAFKLSPWVYWEQEMLMKQYRALEQGKWRPTARQFYTGNSSLPRSYLVAAGGFDTRFRRAEDLELGYRLARMQVQFCFNAQAIGYHYAERSWRSWIEIPYSYGRSDILFARAGEAWLAPTLRKEFRGRHLFIRLLVMLCLDHFTLSRLFLTGLRALAVHSYTAGWPKLARFTLSAIFNLRYYQGVADELGGRERFLIADSR
ncbi:MAG: glycosyltransferase [Candidatus Viridilinea halotolerans]|uniref:Glycosyltransferase n=1 Tax=Candidatus Viridilinea halotolerans TaxID=2491704 RepID=A0A426TR74_9CHLR|nr:MAG: glycosyltransferase [Candidatus Viridilinea halotolerans]